MQYDEDKLVQDLISGERPWLVPFLKGRELILREFPWGYSENPFKAVGTDARASISILISGFIEVYEEHFVECESKSRYAYRPIKLFEPGDIFGDFELIDQAVFEGKQLELGEEWGIAYGGRSALFYADRAGIDKEHFVLDAFKRNQRRDYAPHHALKNLLRNKNATVKVAEFVLDELDDDQRKALFSEIMKAGWKKAYTYRLCANSYNIQERFRFHQIAKQQTERLGDNSRLTTTKESKAVTHKTYGSDAEKEAALQAEVQRVARARGKAQYDSRVNYRDIVDIFIDSLYDAINRPIRDEPVYAASSRLAEHYDLTQISPFGKLMLPVRISRDVKKLMPSFYFPLGLANFLMCNYVSLFDEANAKARFFEGLGAEALSQPKMVGTACVERGSKTQFWKDVAERIIFFHEKQDEVDNVVRRLRRRPYSLALSVELKRDFNDDYDLQLVYTRVGDS